MVYWFFGLLAVSSSAVAQQQPEAAVQTQYSEYQQKSVNLQEKQREILADIYRMTNHQRRLAAKKSEQLQRREELEADVADLQQDIQEVTQEIQTLRRKIVLRMRNLHRVSAPTIFQSLFGAHDLMEMDRNARIMYKISKSDVDQIRTFRGLKNLLSEQQFKLEKKIAEFEKTQKNLERQEQAIKRTYTAQMDLLKQLGQQDQTILTKLKEIKKKSLTTLDDRPGLVTGLFEGGIYEKKGHLEFPTQGVVSRKFGLLTMPSPKIRVYNKGWFIATIPGKDVQSVHKGHVAYVGELQDYNHIVIVDHGDHFYSVYGNLAQPLVQVGEEIQPQQVLGQTGQSRINGTGLYFEMRHFSQSEDPAEWFKNSRFHISSVKEQGL